MSTEIEDKTLDYDAEVMKEEILKDKAKAPSVNVQKDYEQSKKFSTPDHELEPEEVSSSLGSPFNPSNKDAESSAEGNPENFIAMAQEVNPDSEQ